MLQESMLTALNLQMAHEYNNSYIYQNFSGIADFIGLIGASKWFKKQSDEEKIHGDKLFTYISDQCCIPHLHTIQEQCPEVLTLDNMFMRSIEVEKKTTENLKMISQLAKELGDDQTFYLMQWYLEEQIQEEKSVTDIYKRILLSSNNLIIIDQELGERA